MYPFATPWKCFQGVEKGCIGNKWVKLKNIDASNFKYVWDKINYLIKSENDSGNYDDKYFKIRFKSDESLPFKKKSKCIVWWWLLGLHFMIATNITHMYFKKNVCII